MTAVDPKGGAQLKVHVLHDNPDWYPPFAGAFAAEGIDHEQWLLGEGPLDLDAIPPPGVYWSRISASSHTRGRPLARDQARTVLGWLESHGRRVVGGRRVLELEMSKAAQHAALRAAGFDVPRTVAVAGRDALAGAAAGLPAPYIVKHNQGGKGLGVRRFDTAGELAEYAASDAFEPSPDGITLVQEYVRPAGASITRVEVVGGRYLYAITADVERGGFELCPADACAAPGAPGGLFTLRAGFDEHPIIGRYVDFARRQGIEIAGFEFIETAEGRLVTYDVNTNTNYNPDVEAVAPRSGPAEIARFIGGLLAADTRPFAGPETGTETGTVPAGGRAGRR